MNKQELIRDIKASIGGAGVISENQLARYLGKSRNRKYEENGVRQYVEDLPYVPDGRGKKYYVIDVAARLMDKTVNRRKEA